MSGSRSSWIATALALPTLGQINTFINFVKKVFVNHKG